MMWLEDKQTDPYVEQSIDLATVTLIFLNDRDKMENDENDENDEYL
jgi:hypothetical protein